MYLFISVTNEQQAHYSAKHWQQTWSVDNVHNYIYNVESFHAYRTHHDRNPGNSLA